MSRSHEPLAHPSDIGFVARGPDVAGALAECVRALADVITGGGPVEPRDRRVVTVAGGDEERVVALLEECLFELDAHGWLAGDAEVGDDDGERLTLTLLGEVFDPDRHGEGVHVKAVTWHGLSVARDGEGVAITVFVDI